MSTNWWIECGAFLPKGGFARNHIVPLNKVISFRMKWDNRGVFTTAYVYDDKNQKEAKLYGDFYLDFDYDIVDSEDQESAYGVIRNEVVKAIRYLKGIYSIDPAALRIYFSGSKGIHITIPKEILGIEPHKNLNVIYRVMAEDIKNLTQSKTIDLKIYDRVRLFRIPNSVHQKTNLYKIPLTYAELMGLTYKEIKEMAAEPRIEPKIQPTLNSRAHMQYMNYLKKVEAMINKPKGTTSMEYKLDYTPPCVEALLKNPIGQGQRNDSLAFLASFFRQSGYGEDEATGILIKWGDDMCSPSIHEHEVRITVNSIYRGNGKMGCSKARIISTCEQDKCKLSKKGF